MIYPGMLAAPSRRTGGRPPLVGGLAGDAGGRADVGPGAAVAARRADRPGKPGLGGGEGGLGANGDQGVGLQVGRPLGVDGVGDVGRGVAVRAGVGLVDAAVVGA